MSFQGLKCFAVYDVKVKAFLTPFFSPTASAACRVMRELVHDPASMVGKYPEDFTLYQVGEFDDMAGELTPETPPKFVIKLDSLVPFVATTSPFDFRDAVQQQEQAEEQRDDTVVESINREIPEPVQTDLEEAIDAESN